MLSYRDKNDWGPNSVSSSIGLCIATYNGEGYLQEQLESIKWQTCRPDEIVISDDGSSDQTLRIIDDFKRTSGFQVTVIDHSKVTNRPWDATSNFCDAVLALTTDLIAFCDQDDIWMPKKLERMKAAFTSGSDVKAVIHSYRDILSLPSGQKEVRVHRLLDGIVYGLNTSPVVIWPGMACAIRRELVPMGLLYQESWESHFNRIRHSRPDCLNDHWTHMHDVLFLTTAKLHGSIASISEVLADHRLHDRNVTQTKETWSQAGEVKMSWGSGQDVNYRVQSAFCSDFCRMLGEPEWRDWLGERWTSVVEHYERWARILELRADAHDPGAGNTERLRRIISLVALGAYDLKRKSGLGPLSFAKDVANLFVGLR